MPCIPRASDVLKLGRACPTRFGGSLRIHLPSPPSRSRKAPEAGRSLIGSRADAVTHVNDKPARDAAEINFDSVARVASAVQLSDIALRSSHCAINVSASSVPSDWAADAFVGFDMSAVDFETKSGELRIHAAFVVVFSGSWESEVLTEPPPFDPDAPPDVEMQASFELVYSVPESPQFNQDDIQSFAVANGTLHAWPYWREFADNMAQRMQIPRLLVGVFKLPSAHDPHEPSDSEDQPREADST